MVDMASNAKEGNVGWKVERRKSGVVDCAARRNGASGGIAQMRKVQTDEVTRTHWQKMDNI